MPTLSLVSRTYSAATHSSAAFQQIQCCRKVKSHFVLSSGLALNFKGENLKGNGQALNLVQKDLFGGICTLIYKVSYGFPSSKWDLDYQISAQFMKSTLKKLGKIFFKRRQYSSPLQ